MSPSKLICDSSEKLEAFWLLSQLLLTASSHLHTHRGRRLATVDEDRLKTPYVRGWYQSQPSRCQGSQISIQSLTPKTKTCQCPESRVRGQGSTVSKVGRGVRRNLTCSEPFLTHPSLPPPSLCPQCFSRIMALSWARKSAVPPVSSPARQDRCKVGGQRKNQGINSSIQNIGGDPAVAMRK